MVYQSTNELDCFQFHDATIREIKLIDTNMIWLVAAINAMTTNTQNDNEKDMCVSEAIITFENITIEKIEYGAYKVYDSNSTLIKSVDAKTEKLEKYASVLKESTSSYCYIYGMDEYTKLEDNTTYRACFNIDGGAGSFYITFTFSKAVVEWNEYDGEAWYEHPKWKEK